MKGILDAGFRYTPSHSTDIRKTFERIRRERQATASSELAQEHREQKVLPLATARKAGSQ